MRVCKFEGCDRKHVGKGYCATHYRQLVRTGTVQPIGMGSGRRITPAARAAILRSARSATQLAKQYRTSRETIYNIWETGKRELPSKRVQSVL